MTRALGAILLLLLLLFPTASAARSGDEPRDEKEVRNGYVFSFDDEPIVIRTGRHAARAYLGIRLIEITPQLREHFGAPRDAGVLVGEVEPGSPAAKAGVQVGDVITRVDGEPIESSWEVSHSVRRKNAGESVKIEIERNKTSRTLTATIEERPAREIALGDLGREIRERTRGLRDLHIDGPKIGRLYDFGRIEKRLEEVERRLQELEKKSR